MRRMTLALIGLTLLLSIAIGFAVGERAGGDPSGDARPLATAARASPPATRTTPRIASSAEAGSR